MSNAEAVEEGVKTEIIDLDGGTIIVPPPYEVPDGGLRAWSTVAGSWLVSSCTFGYMNAFGVYQALYIEEVLPAYSPSTIAWIGSIQMFLLLAFGSISGRLFDRGYFRSLIIVGTIIYVGCIFAQSAAETNGYYQIFLSQGLGQGLGQGILYLPTLGVMGHHFRKRRALAMGLVVTGSSTGGIFFPIMLNNLFVHVGYRWTVRAAGFLILGILVLANLLMWPNYPPKSNEKPPNPGTFFKEAHYVIAILAVFFVFWGIAFPFFFMQVYSEFFVTDPVFPFYTLSIINAASLFGRSLPNLFTDKLGPMRVIVPCTFICCGIIWSLFGVTNEAAIIVFCLFFGFFSGAYIGVMGPMFANMANSVNEIGVRMGLGMAFMGLAGTTGTPIIGALVGDGPDYVWWKAFVFSGVCIIVGTSLLVVTWVLLAKKRGHWKV